MSILTNFSPFDHHWSTHSIYQQLISMEAAKYTLSIEETMYNSLKDHGTISAKHYHCSREYIGIDNQSISLVMFINQDSSIMYM